jgi:hypothetical protein
MSKNLSQQTLPRKGGRVREHRKIHAWILKKPSWEYNKKKFAGQAIKTTPCSKAV